MSTTENIVEVTEEPKVKFRLFNDLSGKWHTYNIEDMQAEFYIRPMSHTERAKLRNAEKALFKSRNIEKAIKESENESDIVEKMTINVHSENEFLDSLKETIISCITKMRIDGVEENFTEAHYERLRLDSVRMWFIQTIESESNLKPEERMGL